MSWGASGFGAAKPAFGGSAFGTPAPGGSAFGTPAGGGAFGSPAGGAFGGAATGGSAFGATTPGGSAFGRGSAFGGAATGGAFGGGNPGFKSAFGSGGGGAFGGAASTAGSGAFGSTAFGGGATGGSAFGASPSSGFGRSTGVFGATQQSSTASAFGGGGAFGGTGGAFGSTGGTGGAFGSTPGGAFGRGATTGGAFGSTGFGATAGGATGAGGGLFGARSPATGFGGATTGTFGSPAAGGATGTAIQPYQAVKETVQGGQKTIYRAITAAKVYQNKSFEELRMEDYAAGRNKGAGGGGFGSTMGASTLGGGFGQAGRSPFGGAATSAASSPFGAAKPFGATGGAFGQAATPGFGGATTGFGATTTGFGTTGFGATASSASSMFGKPAATGFGQQATSPFKPAGTGGAFGATTGGFGATTGGFGAGAATGFGAGATTGFGAGAATGFGAGATGFGAKPTTGFGGGFGASPGGFGATASSASTGFGARPATGAFGTTGFGSPFGAASTASGGAGMFGKTSTSPFTGFGGATSSAGGLGGGFGTTGGFGGGGGFGAMSKPSAFGTPTMGGFGAGLSKPGGFGGGFGQTTGFNQTANTGLGMGSPMMGGGLGGGFGNQGMGMLRTPQFAQQQQQQQAQPQPQAAYTPNAPAPAGITASPYGDQKHFRIGPEERGLLDHSASNGATEKHSTFAPPHVKLRRRIQPRPANYGSLIEPDLEIHEERKPDKVELIPRRSVKKLVIRPHSKRSPKDSWISSKPSDQQSNGDMGLSTPKTNSEESTTSQHVGNGATPVTKQLSHLNSSVTASGVRRPDPVRPTPTHTAPPTPYGDTVRNANGPLSPNGLNGSPRRGIKVPPLKLPPDTTQEAPQFTLKPGYEIKSGSTRLPLEALEQMPMEDLRSIPELTIIKPGVGQVQYFSPTDLSQGMDMEAIVTISHKSIDVYPPGFPNKPSVGNGLNKPARVTLYDVLPIDKASKEPIRSPERLTEYAEKVKKKTIASGAKFIDYDNGTWVFEVEHFSRFGMDDDDEDEDFGGVMAAKKLIQAAAAAKKKSIPQSQGRIAMDSSDEDSKSEGGDVFGDSEDTKGKEEEADDRMDDEDGSGDYSKSSGGDEQDQENDDEEEDEHDGDDDDDERENEDPYLKHGNKHFRGAQGTNNTSSTQKLVQGLGLQRVPFQVMKASLFDEEVDADGEAEYGEKTVHFSGRDMDMEMTTSIPSQPMWGNPASMAVASTPFSTLKGNSKNTASAGRNWGGTPQKSIQYQQPMTASSTTVSNTGGTSGVFSVRPTTKKTSTSPVTSLLEGRHNSLVDAGLLMNRGFRVGWGPNGTLVHCGKRLGKRTSLKSRATPFGVMATSGSREIEDEESAVHIERVDLTESYTSESAAQTLLEPSLQIQFEFSERVPSDEPVAIPQYTIPSAAKTILSLKTHVKTLRAISSGQQLPQDALRDVDHTTSVFQLVDALWGCPDLPEENSEMDVKLTIEDHSALTQYAKRTLRRHAVTQWIAQSTHAEEDMMMRAPVTPPDLANPDNEEELAEIFNALSVYDVAKACAIATEHRDYRLAMLLAQVSSGPETRAYVRHQLVEWHTGKRSADGIAADDFINKNRLKLYALVAGCLIWPDGPEEIGESIMEGLDWKRAFGIALWYGESSNNSVEHGMELYENSFSGETPVIHSVGTMYGGSTKTETQPRAQAPLPPYMKQTNTINVKSAPKDTCFHLLKLYCQRSHSLEETLLPSTSTPAHRDVRLSWHLYALLQGVGMHHLPPRRERQLHEDFACQLESVGLWHWGVFVLMHIADPNHRAAAVKAMIERNGESSTDKSRIAFLTEQLGIPPSWLYESLALRARYESKPKRLARQLLKAEKWNEAHTVIVSQLASQAIVNGNHKYLEKMLGKLEFAAQNNRIEGWGEAGQVYLDYVRLFRVLETVQTNEELESLVQLINALCSGRIADVPCKTLTDRLCRAEMATKLAGVQPYAQKLLNPHVNDHNVFAHTQVSHYLETLPLTEQHRLSQLTKLSHAYTLQIQS